MSFHCLRLLLLTCCRDLSRNNIYAIEVDIFKNLTNLKRLDLSQNNITSIGEGCFSGLENLERL